MEENVQDCITNRAKLIHLDHPQLSWEHALDVARWAMAAKAATEAAHRIGMKSGSGYIYGRDGGVYRRMPDGSEERLT